ncbi:MAG: hypothetical protein WD403_02700 [Pirellulales bacterium]
MGWGRERGRQLPGHGVLGLVALCCLSILFSAAAPRKLRLARAAPLAEENGSPVEDKGKKSENDSQSVRREGQRLGLRDRLARADVVARQTSLHRQGRGRLDRSVRPSCEHDLRNGLGTSLRI